MPFPAIKSLWLHNRVQAEFMKTMSSVAADVSKDKPALADAYKIVSEAAQRTRQSGN
jgi:hypothetical protein